MAFERTKARITTMENAGATINGVLDVWNFSLHEARSQNCVLVPSNLNMSYMFSAMEKAMAELIALYNEQKNLLTAVTEEMQQRLAEQKNDLVVKQHEVMQISADVQLHEENQSKMQNLEREILELTQKLESVSDRAVENKEKDLALIRQQYEDSSKVIQKLVSQFQEMTQDAERINQDIETTRAEVDKLEKQKEELRRLSERLEALRLEARNADDLEKQINNSLAEIEAHEAKLKKYGQAFQAFHEQKLSKEDIAADAEISTALSKNGKTPGDYKEMSAAINEEMEETQKKISWVKQLLKRIVSHGEVRTKKPSKDSEEP